MQWIDVRNDGQLLLKSRIILRCKHACKRMQGIPCVSSLARSSPISCKPYASHHSDRVVTWTSQGLHA